MNESQIKQKTNLALPKFEGELRQHNPQICREIVITKEKK